MKKRFVLIALLALAALLFVACGDDDTTSGQTFTSSDTPMDVPGDGSSADSTITVSGGPTSITKMKLTVNIPHTQTGYLYIYLYGPNYPGTGTTGVIQVATAEGGVGSLGLSGGYLNVTFDDDAPNPIDGATMPPGGFVDNYRPVMPLSTYDGIDANGTWRLSVEEQGASSINGEITSWSITFE